MKKEIVILIIGVVLCITGSCMMVYSVAREVLVMVTYDDGTMILKNNVKKGKITEAPYTPTKEGYEFLGWYYQEEEFNFNKKIDKDITLTAKWKEIGGNTTEDKPTDTDEKKEKFTIKFDSDGGSNVANQTINEGDKVKRPTNPTKNNYVFDNWYLDDKVYNFNQEVTKDITLTAKWKEKDEFTVKFNSNGGSSVSSQTIKKGQKVKKPTNPTKSNYVFDNWYLDDKVYNFNQEVTKDITLTAKWKEKDEFTVKFNSNGGSSVSSQTIKKGQKVKKPTNPTKSNYVFDNWYLDDKVYNFNQEVTKDITLTAKWKEKDEFTVKFNSDGGSSVSSQTVKKGQKAEKPADPTKNNYNFVNWYLGDSIYNFNQEVTKDITLTAKWEYNGVYVDKVTLDKTSHKMTVGDKVTLTATVEPSNATNKNVTWESSNQNVATVSNGVVTAVGTGTVTITATAEGKKVTCTITVTKKITYTYEIKDIPESTTGQCYIYVKSSEGNYVDGKVTITYINGNSETVNVPANGYMFPNKATISSITNATAN